MKEKANEFVCVDNFFENINLKQLNAKERRLALECVEMHDSYETFVRSHDNDKLFVDKGKSVLQLEKEHSGLTMNEHFVYFNWFRWSHLRVFV